MRRTELPQPGAYVRDFVVDTRTPIECESYNASARISFITDAGDEYEVMLNDSRTGIEIRLVNGYLAVLPGGANEIVVVSKHDSSGLFSR